MYVYFAFIKRKSDNQDPLLYVLTLMFEYSGIYRMYLPKVKFVT